jgi:hypothetical protein
MRVISMLALMGLVGAGACGGGSGNGLAAKDACKQNAAAFCERLLRCEGANGLSAMGYVSVVDCTEHVQASSCTGGSDICSTGQTYNADKAQSCVNAVKDLACSSETSPPVCAEVCTDSPLSGGSLSYEDACKKMATAVCSKAFACGYDSELSIYVSEYSSEAACISEIQTGCSENQGCPTGKTYHGDKAKQCVTEFTALSCSNLGDQPAVCEEVCSTSSSGTGGMGGVTPAGLSAREFCNQVYATLCDRCFVDLGISSVADCLSILQAPCVEATESDICPSGTYRPDKGPACVNAVKTESCRSGLASPACETESLCD